MIDEEERKKYKRKISDYMRRLHKEKERIGYYSNGAGKRYLIGGFYLLSDDTEGAINYFKWYEQQFCSEDEKYYAIESENIYIGISRSFLFYKIGNFSKSKQEFIKTILYNPSVTGFLIGDEVKGLDKKTKDFNDMKLETNLHYTIEYYDFMTNEYGEWLKKIWNEDKIQEIISDYFTFKNELSKINGVDNRIKFCEDNRKKIYLKIEGLI